MTTDLITRACLIGKRVYLSGWTQSVLLASTFIGAFALSLRGDPHALFLLAAIGAITWIHEFSHAAAAEYYGWTWYMRYSKRTAWNPAVKCVPLSPFYQKELARIAFAPIIPTLVLAIILTPLTVGGAVEMWMLPTFAVLGSLGDYAVVKRELMREQDVLTLTQSLPSWAEHTPMASHMAQQ